MRLDKEIAKYYYTAAQARNILGINEQKFQYEVRKGTVRKTILPGRSQGLYSKREINEFSRRIEAAILVERSANIEFRLENDNLVEWATEQASTLLPLLETRWKHVQGVVEQACWIGKIFNEEEYSLLVAAAYLHDIGYAPSLNKIGYHPLDGANHLLAQGQERLASLIAYHSEAQFEAHLRGFTPQLIKYPRDCSAIAEALTYCDLTTNSTGQHVSLEERIADIINRYDDTNIVIQALRQALPSWTIAIEHTKQRLYEHRIIINH